MTTINLPEAGEPGLEGTVNLADIEALGRFRLPRNALEYYASGANDEVTLHANREGFRRLRLRPRVLVDVSHVNTHTEVLGLPLGCPVGIAPSAFHGLAHPEAEVATARAASGFSCTCTPTATSAPNSCAGPRRRGRGPWS